MTDLVPKASIVAMIAAALLELFFQVGDMPGRWYHPVIMYAVVMFCQIGLFGNFQLTRRR